MTDGSASLGGGMSVQTLKTRALDVAIEMVAKRGPDDVNLRDIAETIGTGVSSLYYYFKSKDALLAEVAAEGFRRLEAGVTAARNSGASPDPIRTCGGAYLRFIREQPMLYKMMYSERILSGFEVTREAEGRAFATFAAGIANGAPSQETEDSALALWAFGRGVASLTMAQEANERGTGRDLARRLVGGLEVLIGRRIRPAPEGNS
ncbi:TetR/AcrR family transcriptional regulator [Phenylobacterium sp.]|uniref:TetR/AcrR family transcriptional regulator n=1 Tax=Phenylobacterium sp. TaxID=1871053 RepID=UPI002E2F5A06|nr:TetR/AcrR family transcriptional regulator [Phenylobacterium sp.]HEX3365379.1 TetR/AcrR family transcriptional regulator [Phenylobacterium sp.]